jgi:hypothetical protein
MPRDEWRTLHAGGIQGVMMGLFIGVVNAPPVILSALIAICTGWAAWLIRVPEHEDVLAIAGANDIVPALLVQARLSSAAQGMTQGFHPSIGLGVRILDCFAKQDESGGVFLTL